jgi:hypothetical protein
LAGGLGIGRQIVKQLESQISQRVRPDAGGDFHEASIFFEHV